MIEMKQIILEPYDGTGGPMPCPDCGRVRETCDPCLERIRAVVERAWGDVPARQHDLFRPDQPDLWNNREVM